MAQAPQVMAQAPHVMAHIPTTTHAARDESYPDHRSADRAGSSRKYGDGFVRAGPTVRMLGISCLAPTT